MDKKKLFIFGGIGLLSILIITSLFFFYNNYSERNINLEISKINGLNNFVIFQIKPKPRINNKLDLLVTVSDTSPSKLPRANWTKALIDEDKVGNTKQGYIVDVKPNGFKWGKLERDPKRFVIVTINKSEYNKTWIEPEIKLVLRNVTSSYNIPKLRNVTKQNITTTYKNKTVNRIIYHSNGSIETFPFNITIINKTITNYTIQEWVNVTYLNITQQFVNETTKLRKFRLPLKNILTTQELTRLQNTTYNRKLNYTLTKNITNINLLIEKNNLSRTPKRIKLHGSSGNFTVCLSGCDYTSLSNWESTENADLTGTGISRAIITENFTDTALLDINGWTTTATDYIQIITNGTARHNGVWNDSSYILTQSSNWATMYSHEDYVRLDGLQITNTLSGNQYMYFFEGAGEVYVDNSIGKPGSGATGGTIIEIGNGLTGIVRNSIFYNSGDRGFRSYGGTNYIYNSIFYNNTNQGIKIESSGSMTIKNCVVFNNGDDFLAISGATFTMDYCASDDGDGTNSVSPADWTTVFEDIPNKKFNLKSTDTQLRDDGTDLSGATYGFDYDIINTTRPQGTRWDIGAFEFKDHYTYINLTTEPTFNHLNVSKTTPYDNLFLYYPIDSNVSSSTIFDYSKYNNDGTITGALFNSTGKYGGALSFDGVNDEVSLGRLQETEGVSELTWSFWTYINEFSESALISKHDLYNTGSWGIKITGNCGWQYEYIVYIAGSVGSGGQGGCVANDLVTDKWNHVVVVYNGSGATNTDKLKVYVNNVNEPLSYLGTIPTSTITSTDIAYIGRNSGANGYFNGTMDELMIFNTSLNSSQVSDIYNNQSARFLSQGTQKYPNYNASINGNENMLNITLNNYQHYQGSNISVSINGTYVNLSNDGTINNLPFTSDPNYLNITFRYDSGTNSFYSPIIIGGISYTSWNKPTGTTDNEYPIFSNYYDNNATLIDSGIALFNTTITSTNGTVFLEINGTNYTATNITTNVYNVSVNFTTSGTWNYYWGSWGNGTSANYNTSGLRSYTINTSVTDTCTYLSGNWDILFSDNCIINSNVVGDLGSNISFTGSGTFTNNAIISRFYRKIINGNGKVINSGRFELW